MNLVKNTLSEQIYQILRNDILTQAIAPGEKLTLKTMQERFGVSSTPVRDAFTRLTEDGLVNYYSNIGVNVINLTKEDLIELYQFMGDLDSLAIRYCRNYPNQKEIITALERTLQQTSIPETPSFSSEEIRNWIDHSDEFHLIFYDYCGNRRLKHAAGKQRGQLTIFSNQYEAVPEMQKHIAKWHHAIYESFRDGDFEFAAQQMKQHLEQSLEFALKMLGQN
ncbi:MAG: GntR family transcriptional regulator [Lachnospiraceae bacterium]|nr:GntR family transcriptional regulator [Lachnospiraceae bacterium]